MRTAALSFVLLPASVLGANLLVSHYTGNIYSVALNIGSNGNGTLGITSTLHAGGNEPSWMSLDSATGTLYVTDETEFGSPVVSAFTVNANNTVSAKATTKSEGGAVMGNLFGGSDGKGFWAQAEYDFSAITTYKNPFSTSSNYLQRLKFTMSGPGPVASRQNAPHPHSVYTDPTGKFLIAADLGADLIRIFSIDATTGNLTACPAGVAGPGDGPRHAAWWTSPSGQTMLYVVNELGNSVTAWQATYPTSGCLSLVKTQSLPAYPAGVSPPSGSKSAEVHVAGDFVYAVNRADQSFGSQQDSAVQYAIDPSTGAISYVAFTNTHVYFPRTFAINKAGDMVAFGGQTSSTVAVVARNTTTGLLGNLIALGTVGTPGQAQQENGMSAVIWDE